LIEQTVSPGHYKWYDAIQPIRMQMFLGLPKKKVLWVQRNERRGLWRRVWSIVGRTGTQNWMASMEAKQINPQKQTADWTKPQDMEKK